MTIDAPEHKPILDAAEEGGFEGMPYRYVII